MKMPRWIRVTICRLIGHKPPGIGWIYNNHRHYICSRCNHITSKRI